MVLRAISAGATMTVMGYVIRPTESVAELAEVFDVMGAQLEPARTRAHRSFAELARLFPERRALLLLAEDDGRIVGGAHIGPRGTLSIALAPQARGQGAGTRLAQMLEEAATRLGLPAINVGGVTNLTRGFYLRLGYQGRGSVMRKGLPLSALWRDPDGWHRDLAELRARRQQRRAAASRRQVGGPGAQVRG
jgi:GNAT superfamily N-acetyltransferase